MTRSAPILFATFLALSLASLVEAWKFLSANALSEDPVYEERELR